MTPDEADRAALIQDMSQEERARLFAVIRKMHGMQLWLYDAATMDQLAYMDQERCRKVEDVSFDLPDTIKVCLLRMKVGEWEFWDQAIGRDRFDGGTTFKRFIFKLP